MALTKLPIGTVIKDIIREKKISGKDLIEKTGMSRSGIYATYSKFEMSDAELQKWANALDVTKEEMVQRRSLSTPRSAENSDYLLDHLTNLEEQFKQFREQLQVKDMQIASLQRMLELTLGKYDGVIRLKTTPVREMYPEAGALEA